MKTPQARIHLIERSLRCFRRSWWSFVPLFGIGPAISSLLLYRQVRRDTGQDWNPAIRWLRWGAFVGLVNFFTWGIILLAILIRIASHTSVEQ